MAISKEEAELLLEEAKQLIKNAQFDKALGILDDIAPVFEELEQWERYVECLNGESEVLYRNGQYDTGLEMAKKSLAVSLEKWGEIHEFTAKSYAIIGKFFLQKRNFNQAIKLHQKAVEIRKNLFEENHYILAENYNDIGSCYFSELNLPKAEYYYKKALDIKLNSLTVNLLDLAIIYHNLGNFYEYNCMYDIAIANHKQALEIRLKELGDIHLLSSGSYLGLGNCFLGRGNYNSAMLYYKKSLYIRLTLSPKHPDIINSYANIAICYRCRGDYDMAIFYLQQALDLLQVSNVKDLQFFLPIYINLGNCYRDKNLCEKGVEYFEKVLFMATDFPKSKELIFTAKNNLGICHRQKGDYDIAIDYFLSSLSDKIDVLGEYHPSLAITYNNIGLVYKNKSDYLKALLFFEKSLNIRIEILKKHPDIAINYGSIGQMYYEQGDYTQALAYYQLALQHLDFSASTTDYLAIPTLIGCTSSVVLLDTFAAKSQALFTLYQTEQNPDYLQSAFTHYSITDQLIDHLRNSFQTEGSKFTLAEKAKDIYDDAITVANTADALETAFHFSEKAHSTILFSHIKDKNARANSHIAPDDLAQEQHLRQELAAIERQIGVLENQEIAKRSTDYEERLMALNGDRLTFIEQQKKLLQTFETRYPDYYQLKYSTKTVSIAEIKATLPPNTAIIEYFVGKDSVHVFCITSKHYGVNTITINKPTLEQTAKEYLRTIRNIDTGAYIQHAQQLYEWLIAPIQNVLEEQHISDLIIVADDVLQSIPFESFITNPAANFDTYTKHHLVFQYTIQHHYSATLWHYYHNMAHGTYQIAPSAGQSSVEYVGFAPVIYQPINKVANNEVATGNNRSDDEVLEDANENYLDIRGSRYKNLPATRDEIETVAKMFTHATSFFVEEANVGNFKKNVHRQSVKYIHVAAHGSLNKNRPELSGIVFSPEPNNDTNQTEDDFLNAYRDAAEQHGSMLYSMDAYQLDLKGTDLVVLSCCDTGVGTLRLGEGLVATNRGFLYAGAKNIIYTLFKVEDKNAALLMQEFFTQLSEGKPVHKALALAKQQLIKEGKSPLYWAGYVLMGNSSIYEV